MYLCLCGQLNTGFSTNFVVQIEPMHTSLSLLFRWTTKKDADKTWDFHWQPSCSIYSKHFLITCQTVRLGNPFNQKKSQPLGDTSTEGRGNCGWSNDFLTHNPCHIKSRVGAWRHCLECLIRRNFKALAECLEVTHKKVSIIFGVKRHCLWHLSTAYACKYICSLLLQIIIKRSR